jgi:hypothetical protein
LILAIIIHSLKIVEPIIYAILELPIIVVSHLIFFIKGGIGTRHH